MSKKYPLLALLLGISLQIAFSQVLDETFKFGLTKTKTDTRFQAMAKQPDGKIVAIGNQYFVNGSMQRGIMRLNADLSVDESFTGVLPQTLFFPQNAMAIQADGKIVLAGIFGNGPIGQTFTSGILRLNSDGTIDESFNPGSGFNTINNIRAIGIDPDGKYIAFGTFTSYNGQAANGVARINPDGSLDNTFNVPAGFSMANGQIDDLYIQPDGKVILANTGMTYTGVIVPDVIRLNTDGSLDNTFAYTGPTSSHYLLLPEPTGDKIIVISSGIIVRINSDGSVDNTYTGSAGHSGPRAAVRQSDNKIIIAGPSAVIRFNTDGTVDNTFTFGGIAGNFRGVGLDNSGNILIANATSTDMQLLSTTGAALTPVSLNHTEPAYAYRPEIVNNQIIFSGNFEFLDGSPIDYVMSVGKSGTLTPGFDYYSAEPVPDIVSDDNHFFATDGSIPGAMVRVNGDGSLDADFTTNILGVAGNGKDILLMKRLRNGKLLVGGSFDAFNLQPGTSRLVILNNNGSIDNSFSSPAGLFQVHSAAELPDGRIVIADYDVATNNDSLRLISASGTLDTSFKIGFNTFGIVNDIVADNSGNIYAGGSFTTANGMPAKRLLKLSPSGVIDGTFSHGDGFSSSINCLDLQRDQKLLVGGIFTAFDQQLVNGLARLNTDGTRDETFLFPFQAAVSGIRINEGDVYITGNFVRSLSPFVSSIARYATDIAAPSTLSGNTHDCSGIDLTWSDTSTEETGFVIERAAHVDGPFEIIATTEANQMTYTDAGLNTNTTYYYRVKTVNNIGETPPSETVTVATMDIPSISSVTPGSRCGEGTVILSATSNYGDVTWYDAAEDGNLLHTGTTFTTPEVSASATFYAVASAADGQCISESSAVLATVNLLPDATVSAVVHTITAAEAGATYQWVNCNNDTPVSGETDQSFEISESGNYAVMITKGECTVTSDCIDMVFTGFEKSHFNDTVYPNPNNGKFSISLNGSNAQVSVSDIHGRLIYSEHVDPVATKEVTLSQQPAGIYLLTISDGRNFKYIKLLIE